MKNKFNIFVIVALILLTALIASSLSLSNVNNRRLKKIQYEGVTRKFLEQVVLEGISDQTNVLLTPDEVNIDVASYLEAGEKFNLVKKRDELRRLIWRDGDTYQRGVDGVETASLAAAGMDIPSLTSVTGKVERLTVKMTLGVQAHPYYFHTSKTFKGCLMMYHQGHDGHFKHGAKFIERFLADGCDVIAFSMPLYDVNPTPITTTGPASVTLVSHRDFAQLHTDTFSPLKYFIEPVLIALNHALKQRPIERVGMTGLSGGGWTTTLTAALEPRIDFAYPVAGSLPFEVEKSRAWHAVDWEQSVPDLYSRINYFELYLMSVLEPERKARNIHILYDPCCFRGNMLAIFAAQLEGISMRGGLGDLAFLIDDSQRNHLVSKKVTDFIISDFFGRKGAKLTSPSNIDPFRTTKE